MEADRIYRETKEAEEKLERQISSRHSEEHPELISQDHLLHEDIHMPEQQHFIAVDEHADIDVHHSIEQFQQQADVII